MGDKKNYFCRWRRKNESGGVSWPGYEIGPAGAGRHTLWEDGSYNTESFHLFCGLLVSMAWPGCVWHLYSHACLMNTYVPVR